jgi:hypothetical protein
MDIFKKDNLTDVAEGLPSGNQRPANKPAEGTVVANDGTLVTLGGQTGENTKTDSLSHG